MKIRDLLIQHPDGSYEPAKPIPVFNPKRENVTLEPGMRFRRGDKFKDLDITDEFLDREVVPGR